MTNQPGKNGPSSDSCPPLEARLVEDERARGAVTKFPAVCKRFTCTFRSIQFFLPNLESLLSSDSKLCLAEWTESMEIYLEDLKWLLKLPQHKFWSFVIHSKEIAEEILSSFLLRAPRPYDPNFQHFYNNDVVWPLYNEIYSYVFRIYVRLSVFRESKNDHITPSVWGTWIHDNYLLDLPKLFDLCVLCDVEGREPNEILVKMIENIFKHEPRFYDKLKATIPLFLQKLDEPTKIFSNKIQSMISSENIDEHLIQDLLTFQIDTLASLHKFLKYFSPTAQILYEFPQFLNSLANSYEATVKLLGSAVINLPHLLDQLSVYRSFALLLFRTVLSQSTILPTNDGEHECDLDGFFNCLTACLDDKAFIYDYSKAFPFICDIEGLIAKGIMIDETRVAYVHNAISACYMSFGERFPELDSKFISKPKMKKDPSMDPLLDPYFDRQLLGACSLEVTGPEFTSLVSQVKDLFTELSTPYIEACIKFYGFDTEKVINAILEGNVASHLDRYKFDIPSNEQETSSKTPKEEQVLVNNEVFHKGKWSHGIESDEDFLDANKSELKSKIIESLQISAERESDANPHTTLYSYVDQALLPTFDQHIEYEDEYDDTYDEGLVGGEDPESWLYNPLNRKADEEAEKNGNGNNFQEDNSQEPEPKHFDHFVEDPAIVRARMERARQEKYQRNHKFVPPPQSKDVVGKAKGQGQDKEVLVNRRHKEASKDAVANHSRKKRSDWKRREF